MANTIHFNAFGSTFQDEFCSGFAFQAMDQKNEGYIFLHLAQEVQHLHFLPVGAGVLGHDKVKGLRTESVGELLGTHNYI